MVSEYEGHRYVDVDLYRKRSVIVRQTDDGIQLSAARILNDPVAPGLQIEQAGSHPDVVLKATYGWFGRCRRAVGQLSDPLHGAVAVLIAPACRTSHRSMRPHAAKE
ncbi:hypothetical protein ACWD3I_22835 [Streptomyces sp. NPDC002817]|uniref:hypothetical protein n=1 Tax=Streptomyces sp. NPDC088357 TaxID=3154655 RepID=UPI003435A385